MTGDQQHIRGPGMSQSDQPYDQSYKTDTSPRTGSIVDFIQRLFERLMLLASLVPYSSQYVDPCHG
jgi:hypothetical protein